MNESNAAQNLATQERRRGSSASVWGELVVEMAWRPTDKPRVESEGWLRAHGYLPERRAR